MRGSAMLTPDLRRRQVTESGNCPRRELKGLSPRSLSDDGDIWTIDEEGRVQVAAPTIDSAQPAAMETKTEGTPGRMWPYFDYDEKTDPRRIIIWLMACQPERKADLAERCLADGLRIPLHEAAAALRAWGPTYRHARARGLP